MSELNIWKKSIVLSTLTDFWWNSGVLFVFKSEFFWICPVTEAQTNSNKTLHPKNKHKHFRIQFFSLGFFLSDFKFITLDCTFIYHKSRAGNTFQRTAKMTVLKSESKDVSGKICCPCFEWIQPLVISSSCHWRLFALRFSWWSHVTADGSFHHLIHNLSWLFGASD